MVPELLTVGQILAVQARIQPDRIGARDLERAMSFRLWNQRSCRLANALLGIGLAKGDRVAILAYNCVEWLELYAALAKAGLVAVPINFRLTPAESRYMIDDSEAAALVVQHDLLHVVEDIRADLAIPAERYIRFGRGAASAGYRAYEDLIAAAADAETGQSVSSADTWTLMYTSGTTGRPKGVVRNHAGAALMALVTEIELGIGRGDDALLVMPMCHANSLFFFGAFSYCGAVTTVHSRKSFDPEECARTLAGMGSSFTSLVPTHYIIMLDLPEAARRSHQLDRVTKLMISSAPARQDTKRGVMAMFRSSGLFELYGSTEAGWVTMLHPDEQFTKLGSVGRECVGSRPIRILDEAGDEVPDGEAGELHSSNPYTFDGYWRLPEKTREALRGEYCTVGDMARRDADGYIHLVDRKSNMIISGGENVYPSEVEALLGTHPAVQDVAVVGLPDGKWGERVHAAVVLRDGAAPSEAELVAWCRDRIAGFKRPRSCTFLAAAEMPRTATGKIQHRILKAQLTAAEEGGEP